MLIIKITIHHHVLTVLSELITLEEKHNIKTDTVSIQMIVPRKVRLEISVITKQFFENFLSTERLSHELYKDIILSEMAINVWKVIQEDDKNLIVK